MTSLTAISADRKQATEHGGKGVLMKEAKAVGTSHLPKGLGDRRCINRQRVVSMPLAGLLSATLVSTHHVILHYGKQAGL